ncbi:MAG: hypothetical protein ACE5E0_01770, partial [Terriglobia bacterium]
SAGSSAAFHEEDRVPYFTYHDAKGYHEVWYENVRSFREKQAVITASGAKTGAFVLGFEDPGVWAEIPSVPVSDPKNFDITEPKDGATVTGPFTLRLSASQDLSEVKIFVD